MNVCAASAKSKRGLSPKAETDRRICRVAACGLVPDHSPRDDLAGAAGDQRWPGRRRSDLPRRRRDTACAAEAGPSRARLRPVRYLPVARIAAGHPGAAATASREAIGRHRAPRRSLSPRAACASGRRRPTAWATFPELSLDFARRRRQGPASRFISVEPPSHAPPNRARLTRLRKPACQRTRIRTRLRRPAYVHQHTANR